MARNHGNLYVTLLSLVLGRYGVLRAELNGAEEGGGEGRTGTGTKTGMEKDSRCGRNGAGNVKKGRPERAGRAVEYGVQRQGGGACLDGVQGGAYCRGEHVEGGRSDTQG